MRPQISAAFTGCIGGGYVLVLPAQDGALPILFEQRCKRQSRGLDIHMPARPGRTRPGRPLGGGGAPKALILPAQDRYLAIPFEQSCERQPHAAGTPIHQLSL
ncbi:MAG: hypothetical protein JSV81_05265, partial [Anaerolineales bacterium]